MITEEMQEEEEKIMRGYGAKGAMYIVIIIVAIRINCIFYHKYDI